MSLEYSHTINNNNNALPQLDKTTAHTIIVVDTETSNPSKDSVRGLVVCWVPVALVVGIGEEEGGVG